MNNLVIKGLPVSELTFDTTLTKEELEDFINNLPANLPRYVPGWFPWDIRP